jgi:hypothetical protein
MGGMGFDHLCLLHRLPLHLCRLLEAHPPKEEVHSSWQKSLAARLNKQMVPELVEKDLLHSLPIPAQALTWHLVLAKVARVVAG